MTATVDRWGRSIPKMEAELAAARAALDAAAAKARTALDAVDASRTDRAEARAWTAWNKAHEEQNRAAQRLHAANQALGRPPRS